MVRAHQTLRASINCGGIALECGAGARALIMGILNVTPDSFSDGGLYLDLDEAVARANEMVSEGADILDVGGESSRPTGTTYGAGATVLSASQEISRVVPVVEAVARAHPDVVVSVDTYKASVAEAAIKAGARMVNDITALRADSKMADVVSGAGVPVVLMHSVGKPGQMPHERHHDDIVSEVKSSLAEYIQIAESHGIADIVVDPGFGFGKSVSDNLRLVAELDSFHELERPILIGLSRKSSVGMAVGDPDKPRPVHERLYGSLAGAAMAIMNGASIVRTHDVRPTRDVAEFLHEASSSTVETDQALF